MPENVADELIPTLLCGLARAGARWHLGERIVAHESDPHVVGFLRQHFDHVEHAGRVPVVSFRARDRNAGRREVAALFAQLTIEGADSASIHSARDVGAPRVAHD